MPSSSSPSLSSLPRALGRALVVDDDEAVRGLYSEVLGAMGFQVDTAEDAAKALEKIQGSSFGLIISDVRMPGMSGVEFFLKAEQIRPGCEDRFVFTTGLLDSLNANEYLIVTDKPCILKPAKVQDIQQTVLDFIRRNGSSPS
jgi:DNA-binding NtrC family response regulator